MTTRGKSLLRQLVPNRVRRFIKRSRLYIRHRSAAVNIYHCCVQKTGSQWVKAILSDSRTFKYSGLTVYSYQNALPGGYDPRKITDRSFTEPLPKNAVISPLYIDFQNYTAIPKPKHYKAFFVMRDPRDIVVSWYFSSKYSHTPIGELPRIREVLNNLSITDGILYSIEYLHDFGMFTALQSWIDAPRRDPDVLLLRFEDMTAPDNLEVFKELLSHCDIHVPEKVLYQLLQDQSFERLSGRRRGNEDKFAHYRKGVSGDWKNRFNDTIMARFEEMTDDLVTRLGYE